MIETVTYRWKGHSRSDKNLYRTKEEIEEWKHLDPIPNFISKVLAAGILNQEEIDAIAKMAQDQIIEAVNNAAQAKSAVPDGLLEAVFKAVSA